MKNLFLILFFLPLSVLAEEKIKKAKISFDLPNDKWQPDQVLTMKKLAAYIYQREPIMDSSGTEVSANISFIVEKVEKGMDVMTFTEICKQRVSFEILETITADDDRLSFKNAIAYKGTHSDKWGDHTIYVVHLINKRYGVQVVMDIMSELLPQVEDEFLKTLKSIRLS